MHKQIPWQVLKNDDIQLSLCCRRINTDCALQIYFKIKQVKSMNNLPITNILTVCEEKGRNKYLKNSSNNRTIDIKIL